MTLRVILQVTIPSEMSESRWRRPPSRRTGGANKLYFFQCGGIVFS